MIMNNLIKVIINIDLLFCKYFKIISPERPSLIVFTFHKIFKNTVDILNSGVDPQQGTTLVDLKIFIEYFLSAGYSFIDPNDVNDSLNPLKKYILITFDDGYYNNINVLPLLKEYETPSIFFISSNHVLNNEAFWWDVIYRLKENGTPSSLIYSFKRIIKKMNPTQTRDFIRLKLAAELLNPKNDYDRPFNEKELKDFSNEPFVFIGNHTADHAILPNCSKDEAKYQIEKAQTDIENITGKKPKFLSYPNGDYSKEVIDIVKEQQLKLAFTMLRKKNYLPINNQSSLFRINRFMLSSICSIVKDGSLFRSNYSLYNSGINLYSRLNNIR